MIRMILRKSIPLERGNERMKMRKINRDARKISREICKERSRSWIKIAWSLSIMNLVFGGDEGNGNDKNIPTPSDSRREGRE